MLVAGVRGGRNRVQRCPEKQRRFEILSKSGIQPLREYLQARMPPTLQVLRATPMNRPVGIRRRQERFPH